MRQGSYGWLLDGYILAVKIKDTLRGEDDDACHYGLMGYKLNRMAYMLSWFLEGRPISKKLSRKKKRKLEYHFKCAMRKYDRFIQGVENGSRKPNNI